LSIAQTNAVIIWVVLTIIVCVLPWLYIRHRAKKKAIEKEIERKKWAEWKEQQKERQLAELTAQYGHEEAKRIMNTTFFGLLGDFIKMTVNHFYDDRAIFEMGNAPYLKSLLKKDRVEPKELLIFPFVLQKEVDRLKNLSQEREKRDEFTDQYRRKYLSVPGNRNSILRNAKQIESDYYEFLGNNVLREYLLTYGGPSVLAMLEEDFKRLEMARFEGSDSIKSLVEKEITIHKEATDAQIILQEYLDQAEKEFIDKFGEEKGREMMERMKQSVLEKKYGHL
jgi:hypothetical protein